MAKVIKDIINSAGGSTINFDDGSSTFAQEITAPSPNDKFQMLKNPTTGKAIQISKQDFADYGQGLSDMGGYVPIGAIDFAGLPGIGGAPTISQGTGELEDNLNADNNKLNRDIADATGGTSIDKTLADLENMRNNIGTTTDEELKAIEEAGAAAGQQYDALIREAQDKRKTTMASEIVRAGQMGGFENTQLAGTAAVLPTTPLNSQESFVGAGGRLDQSRQILDRNISTLRDAQLRAINAAKSAQREYIQTGKRKNYEDAVKAVELASKLKADADKLSLEKDRLSLDTKRYDLDYLKADRQYGLDVAAEQRLQDRLDFDIQAFNIGEERLNRTQDLAESKWAQELTDKDKANTMDAIKNMASGLVDISKLSDDEINVLETAAQLVPGTFEAFYNGLVRDVQNGIVLDDLKIQKAQADIQNVYSTMSKRASSGGGSYSSPTNPYKKDGTLKEGFYRVGDQVLMETNDSMRDTVNELVALRDQGMLSDYAYNERIKALADNVGITSEEDLAELRSTVNNFMSGEVVLPEVADEGNNPASDFAATNQWGGDYSIGQKAGMVVKEVPGVIQKGKETYTDILKWELGQAKDFVKTLFK